MGWEQRGNRTYYYRKRREGKSVVSEYVGTGEDAALIADLETLYANRNTSKKNKEHQALEQATELDIKVAQICSLIGALTNQVLLANGYHSHKGQWRRKRKQ